MIELTIDGKTVEVKEGATILDAARSIGIDIPTMCYCDKIAPSASCFICVVKVNGQEKFIPSCATPAQNGMVVDSCSDEVKNCRRQALELMLSEHVVLPDGLKCKCASKRKCRLRAYAEEYGADHTRYAVENRKEETRKIYESGLVHEPAKCIVCGKCVNITKAKNVHLGLSFCARGSDLYVSAPFGYPVDNAMGEALKLCAEECPTGALWITPKYGNDKSEQNS
jgi:NADH dehydrogenase/NADH:ubiquinone oxidoreductase subunit G